MKIRSVRSCIEPLEDRRMFSTSVSSAASSAVSTYHVPSVVAATMKDGKLNDVAVSGTRSAGGSTKATTSDKYLIASATKAMTSTLAARLVERGYIKWTSKIVDAFPGLKGYARNTYGKITLAQLLSNRSGLPEDPSATITAALAIAPGTPMKIRNNFLVTLLKEKPVVKPGNYSYSNVGYIVAGAFMETAMRESYENMMSRLVFKPLGMTSASFGWPGSSSTVNEPRPTGSNGKSISPDAINRFPAAFDPSGGVATNITDWSKFVGVQLGQVPKKFLKSDTIKFLRHPYPDKHSTYGMGWNIVKSGFQDYTLIQHDGTDGYWYASVLASTDTDKAVLVLTNEGGSAGSGAAHSVIKALGSKLVSASDVTDNLGDIIKHIF